MRLLFTFVLSLFFLTSNAVQAQYQQVFSEDFEAGTGWSFDDGGNANHFVIGTCGGNSSLGVGDLNSLFVAPKTGIFNGCNSNSDTSYNYQAASIPTDTVTAYRTILHNDCAGNLNIGFDYKIQTGDPNDNAILAYRVNASDPWTTLAVITASTNAFSPANYSLPASLNGLDFQIGFRFAFDNNTTSGIPFAIDNVLIKGTDVVAPNIVCPSSHTLYADASCNAILPDLTGLVSGSDNCTATNDLAYSQNPTFGVSAHKGDTIRFTVYDLANNSATCKVVLDMIDTIKPVVQCNDSLLLTLVSGCQYIVADLSNQVIVLNDNCSTTSNLTISQSIPVGTSSTGIQDVTMSITDEQGNVGQCIVKILPNDTIAPFVGCPANKVVPNGTSCFMNAPDYSSQVTVSDNCTIASITQIPASGQSLTAGNHTFAYVVKDEMGNQATCSFNVLIKESTPPIVVNCPSNITTCNPLVTFATITATDNCVAGVFKTDATNLNSGDVFPIGTTNLQYTARDSSGNTATCNFSVTVLPQAETPSLVQDTINVCNQDSITIVANPVSTGTGYWTIATGSSLTLQDPNQATTVVHNLQEGKNIITWHTTSASCGEKTKNLYVFNAALPSTANIFLDTSYKCDLTTASLTAQPPQKGSGLWTTLDTNIVLTNPQSHNSFATGMPAGWNTFYYTVSNGVCPTSTDSIKVFQMQMPEILNIEDTSLCDKVVLTLKGNEPVSDVGAAWMFRKGTGSFSNDLSSETNLTDYSLGYNIIVYSFSNSYCGVKDDSITIQYQDCYGKNKGEFEVPTMFTPNQDGTNDQFVIDGLNEKYPKCQVTIVNRWGGIVFQSDGYTQPWDGTYKGKPLPIGTYYYVIKFNDGDKKPLNGPISILR